jgi:hypothetical protein
VSGLESSRSLLGSKCIEDGVLSNRLDLIGGTEGVELIGGELDYMGELLLEL